MNPSSKAACFTIPTCVTFVKKPFKGKEIRCLEHNHLSGSIHGFGTQICNYRNIYFIPVVMHNSKSYDNHFILKQMPKNFAKNITLIPCSIEKIQMFTLDSLRFVDSYQFLDTSLEKLVRNLKFRS